MLEQRGWPCRLTAHHLAYEEAEQDRLVSAVHANLRGICGDSNLAESPFSVERDGDRCDSAVIFREFPAETPDSRIVLMDFLEPAVAAEYERWIKIVGEHDPYDTNLTVGLHSVLKAYFLLADYFYNVGTGMGGVGPRDLNLLHSALSRQFVGFKGAAKWSDPFDICATLFFGLIKNYPFHDANKRTALLTALYHLSHFGKTPAASKRELENLTVHLAERTLKKEYRAFERFEDMDDPEVRFVSWFLRRHSRPTDKRFYVITYKQLDAILQRFDCRLTNPVGNTIDVMQMQTRKRGIFGHKQETVERRVANIGFPGWKVEVSRTTIDEVRRATNLTYEKGVDSEAFYRGVSTLDSLIAEYSAPLRRLANK